ncbi:MAG: NAD-dependent epimerase/dehydratase family protein [Polyangiaceae bacterium]
MKIAILGGTRFIGHAAAALAAERGHDVAVLHRGKHPCELASARPIAVDRQDPSEVCESLARLAPDVLIDTRAMSRLDTEVTALAIKVLSLPIVALSSVDVYAQFGLLNGLPGPAPEPLVTEDSPFTIPFPFRGIAGHDAGPDYDKKDVEDVLRRAVSEGAPGAILLRLPAVYGRRDYRRRFGALVDALDAGTRQIPCRGGASVRLSHAHVRDVAHAIVLAAEARKPGVSVYNVGEAQVPTMRERAEAFAERMDARFEWCETPDVPPPFALFGKQPNDVVVSTEKIRAELGFREITTPEERLSDTIAWLRESRI